MTRDKVIAIIGIGYVGLQNAIAISKTGLKVIGFDINKNRIDSLNKGIDNNHELVDFSCPNLVFTDVLTDLEEANCYIIAVPTPINEHFVPNLYPLKSASKMVGQVLKKDDVVVLESTVFPGATRQLLIPIMEEESGLRRGEDFYVGYSSERINPGDSNHDFSHTNKVVSGLDGESLKKVMELYQTITANLHCTPSMEVAESSKLLENIQRDVNIALMNEYAQIMDKMGLSIHDVLDAASTKWNFLPFKPGLVGGHCIPEDPYYLIYEANKLGALPNLISCARQVNEQFVHFIEETCVRLLTKQGFSLKGAKVGLLGISFKANVSDIRHSMSVVLYKNLKALGIDVIACDPLSNQLDSKLNWVELPELKDCCGLILCQAHHQFTEINTSQWSDKLLQNGLIMDIPCVFTKKPDFREDIAYWSL